MSLRDRMGAIVGDENTVARYLLEKVGHTALIAWTIAAVLKLPMVVAGVDACLLYLIVGKVLWHRTHGWSLRWADARDLVFDFWVGLLPAVIAVAAFRGWPSGVVDLACWIAVFLSLDNNAWGSPS